MSNPEEEVLLLHDFINQSALEAHKGTRGETFEDQHMDDG